MEKQYIFAGVIQREAPGSAISLKARGNIRVTEDKVLSKFYE
jgi:hypothetical protein